MKPVSAPLTIELPASLSEKIEAIRVAHDLSSASETIRMALAGFDLSDAPTKSPGSRFQCESTLGLESA